MLDYRIETFLNLCETMNYRETAERLHITQPAVTQHIHHLENEYKCKLFLYDKRRLTKTHEAELLEQYAISSKYNDQAIRQELLSQRILHLRIGVTKTIGDFLIGDMLKQYLSSEHHTIDLTMDNTSYLIDQLTANRLDFAIVEGYFDKERYDYQLFGQEEFLGICSPNHPFANKTISMADIFAETLICREKGSGTRGILEGKLMEYNESLHHFKRLLCISSFKTILDLVANNFGISFVYASVAKSSPSIATFRLKDNRMIHAFYYVYLKNTDAPKKINQFTDSYQNIL